MLPRNTPSTPKSRPRPGWRIWLSRLGLLLLLLAILLLFYGGVAYYGWQSGQTLLQQRQSAELRAELANQLALAETDVASGLYQRALLRLDWVQERDPDYPGAAALRLEAEAAFSAAMTPSPTPTLAPTPTSTPTPEPLEAIQAMEALVDGEQWPEAITAITGFQTTHPNYQRQHTDELLYQAYVNYGTGLLYGEQVELGLFYLAQAGKLGALAQDVLDQMSWADIYLKGIAFYGVDWAASISYFTDLCLSAPFFHDACETLYQARLAYADQLAVAQDWCPAELYYGDAYRQQRSSVLADKLATAGDNCLLATPTPEPAVITDTVPISNTQPVPDSP